MDTPSDLPSARNRPEEGNLPSPPASPRTDQARAREEEARDILAGAIKNQAEDGPSTRKAAIRAYRYLHAMVRQHGPMIQQAYNDAKEHAAHSKGPYTIYQRRKRSRPCRAPAPPARASHNTARAYFRVATLPINPPRPMASCKDYHQHGKCQPMGFQDVDVFLLMNLCDTRWEPTPPSNYLSKKLPLKLYEQHSNTSLTLGRLTLPSCW
jgi:plasmid stability protein